MSRRLRLATGLLLFLGLGEQASAQRYYYPRGYGGYGWGGWGADPASGYMAGLGAFARGQGTYQIDAARAEQIHLDTMLKWNQALRARQRELMEKRREDQAQRQAERRERVAQMDLEDGTTLNNLLARIEDFDPMVSKSARARAKLGARTVHEIPFQWNTEAVSACIDQMTGRDALPEVLKGPKFEDERRALGEAVEAALKEDAAGDVSRAAMRRVSDAVSALRAKVKANVPETFSGYAECEEYLTTLGSLTRLLHDPGMAKALAQLDRDRSITVGDLIAFMQTYNLRFGPATTAEQVRIYKELAGQLRDVLGSVDDEPAPAAVAGKGPDALPSAAREAFKGMDWPQLEAHSRDK